MEETLEQIKTINKRRYKRNGRRAMAEKRMRKEDGGFARDGARHLAKNLAKLAENSVSRLYHTNRIMLPFKTRMPVN